MKMPRNLGVLLLAIWLILYGLVHISFLNLSFNHIGDILGILAVASGACFFLGRW